nr:hypothetical protein [Campylobacter troglodytis]
MKIKDLFANFAKCKGNFKIFLISPSAHLFARSLDLEAKKIAEICKISRPCVNRILREIRILIAKECEKISKMSG